MARDAHGRFVKGGGKPPASGRRRGTPNRLTAATRELVRQAAALAVPPKKGAKPGDGSEEAALRYLVAAAETHPKVFLSILGKTVEREVKVSGDLEAVVEVRNYTGLSLEKIEKWKALEEREKGGRRGRKSEGRE